MSIESYVAFKALNASLITRLAAEIGSVDDETHWDLVSEMKGVLGVAAANLSSDDDAEQEAAITNHENWITEHCSTGDIEEDVCMALWLKGLTNGQSYLKERSASAIKDAFADKSILPPSERQMLNNVLGQPAAVPFYIWANADCANKTDDFEEAKRIRNSLVKDGAEDAYIADADGVEVVDAEIEAEEAAEFGSH